MVKFKLLLILSLLSEFIGISASEFSDFYANQKADLQAKLAEIEAAISPSWKTIYLTRALTYYEQLEALEQTIYDKAIENRDLELLNKLNHAKNDFEIDKRLVVLQYLLKPTDYNQALTNKLREKIDNL